jgi:hypothetical protein
MRLATWRVVLTVSLLVCPQASWRMGGSFFAAPLSTGTTSSSSITTLVHAKVQRQFSSTRLRPSSSSSSSSSSRLYAPTRALAPPFPDGPCGGELVRLDPPCRAGCSHPDPFKCGYHRAIIGRVAAANNKAESNNTDDGNTTPLFIATTVKTPSRMPIVGRVDPGDSRGP